MALANEDRFGEGFWKTGFFPFCSRAPWAGLRNYRTLSLGPAAPGRPPILLVLGGRRGVSYRNDVWRSRDIGQTWEEASPNDEGHAFNGQRIRRKWGGREAFATSAGWMVEGDRLKSLVYVVGGLGPSSPPYSDVWVSEDLGKKFVRMCASAPFGPRVHSGLAVCPGRPRRLVLVGGGWNDDVESWDCWMSMNAGESWDEIRTPINSFQRRMPVVFFTRLGTLLVLGGHNRRVASDDAWLAKVQWLKTEVTWQRFQVYVGVEKTPLEDIEAETRPWFLNHFSVFDLREGVFTGFDPGSRRLALGQLPTVALRGKTPDSFRKDSLNIYISFHDVQLPVRPSRRFVTQPSIHLLLPPDAMRLLVVTDTEGIWSTGGKAQEEHGELRRQLRLLEMLGLQIERAYGLPAEVWDRAVVALLGVSHCRVVR